MKNIRKLFIIVESVEFFFKYCGKNIFLNILLKQNLIFCRLQNHQNGDKLNCLGASSPTGRSMTSFDDDEKIDVDVEDDDDDFDNLDDSRSSTSSPNSQISAQSPPSQLKLSPT